MQVLKGNIRHRILDMAGQLFARHGYAKTSMREVAAQAGIAVGNLYHYFPGKDELFRELLRPVLTAFDTMLQRHHGTQICPPHQPAPRPAEPPALPGARLVVGAFPRGLHRPLHRAGEGLVRTDAGTSSRHPYPRVRLPHPPAHGVDVHLV